jgi:hypothetical protein
MIVLLKHRIPALAVLALLAITGAGNHARGQTPFFTRPAAPAKAPDPDGFLQRWVLLEPIVVPVRNNAELTDSFVQKNVKKGYFPNQFSVIPKDGDRVTIGDAGLTWHALDTSDFNVNMYHFAYDLRKPTFNVVFWAVSIVNCPREMLNVRLSVGSNVASIWWVNSKEVIDLCGDRHMLLDDGLPMRLTLAKGPNIVRAAVINSPRAEQQVRPVSGREVSTAEGVHLERERGRQVSPPGAGFGRVALTATGNIGS